MPTTELFLTVDAQCVAGTLQEARKRLESGEGEAVLDFSNVRRIDPKAVQALEELAQLGSGKAIRITLRGVSVDVYKTLKLMKLSEALSFVD
jgi:anti-anti-sigma regulatory factor